MDENIDITEIMKSIYAEIQEKGLKDDLPAFVEMDDSDKEVNSFDYQIEKLTENWYINTYYETSNVGVKKVIKKSAGKLRQLFIADIVNQVTQFNKYSLMTIVNLRNIVEDQNIENNKLKKEIEYLREDIEKLKIHSEKGNK